MKKLFAVAVALLLLGCAQSATKTYRDIGAEEAYKLIKKNPDVVIIDVRSKDEYDRGHIEGAINIEFSLNFKEKVEKLDRNATILVYCNTGLNSRMAAEILAKLGFRKVYNLVGGIKEWKSKGFPVVK